MESLTQIIHEEQLKYYIFIQDIHADAATGNWTCEVRINNKDDNHPMYTEYKEDNFYFGLEKPTQQELDKVANKCYAEFEKILKKREEERKKSSKFESMPPVKHVREYNV